MLWYKFLLLGLIVKKNWVSIGLRDVLLIFLSVSQIRVKIQQSMVVLLCPGNDFSFLFAEVQACTVGILLPYSVSAPHTSIPELLLNALRSPSWEPDILPRLPWEFSSHHPPAIRQKNTLVQVISSLVWIYLSGICLPASCPCPLIPTPHSLQSVLNTGSRIIVLKLRYSKSHIPLTERSQAHKNMQYTISCISIGKTNLT